MKELKETHVKNVNKQISENENNKLSSLSTVRVAYYEAKWNKKSNVT